VQVALELPAAGEQTLSGKAKMKAIGTTQFDRKKKNYSLGGTRNPVPWQVEKSRKDQKREPLTGTSFEKGKIRNGQGLRQLLWTRAALKVNAFRGKKKKNETRSKG